jgi:WD40 repeat protein
LRCHPDLADELEAFFADQERVDRAVDPLRATGQQQTAEAPTLPPEQTAPTDGTLGTVRYFGDYELLEEIARGGMGVVYKARQVSLNRLVALKMILAGQLASPDDVRRFRTEAEAAANLDHPNIVPIYEVGEHEGQHYFSMKLIDGGSLSSSNRKPRSSTKAQRQAAQLMATVARAVHHANQRGIIHRDLKPGNILLERRAGDVGPPVPHVTDFGLAKRVEGDSKLTRSGAIVGTPSYMAPEQARGEKGLSVAADVYSLGAILYELLTGRPPFQAATPLDTVLQVLDKEPERPRSIAPRIDRDLETICLKCLDKDPKRRYESAAGLADDLERWLAGETIAARRSSAWERGIRWAKRRPALAGMLLVSALSLLSLLLLAGLLWQNAEKRAGMVQDLETARQDLDTARDERAAIVADTRAAQDKARRITYDADMQFAHAAYKADNVQGLLALLKRHRPQTGQEDLRGFEWQYLWRLCHGERFSVQAHTIPAGTLVPGSQAPVMLAFSPDGKTLASTSVDKQIKLWDSATGKHLQVLPQPDPVASLAFTADGKALRLVVAAKPNSKAFDAYQKLVQDVAAGKAKPSLQGLLDALAFRTLPLDGRQPSDTEPFDLAQLPSSLSMFAILGGGPEVAGSFLTSAIPLKGRMVVPMCLALSLDRKTLAIGGISTPIPFIGGKSQQEGVVLLWDLVAGKDRAILMGHGGFVISLAFAPDGRSLASTGFDKVIRLWDVAEARERATLGDQAALITSLIFSADGQLLVSGNADGAVKLWDAVTGQLRENLLGHVNAATGVALTPDGRSLASGSVDGIVKLWDATRTLGPIHRHLDRGILAFAVCPDGRALAVADQGRAVRFYDPITGQEQKVVRLMDASSNLPGVVDDARRIADGARPQGASVTIYLRGAIAPDAKKAAIADLSVVSLFDIDSGKEVQRLQTPNGVNYALAFSPDSKILAVGSGSARQSGEVALWDVSKGNRRATLSGHRHHVRSLAFSPDGKTLASGSSDQTVKIWDVASGAEKQIIGPFSKGISALAFSRDGRKLAVAAADTISIREAATGEEILSIRGYSIHVLGMAFSPDGARLATAGGADEESGKGGGVRLWDLGTGQELLNLTGPTDVVTDVAFSPDGQRLISSSILGGDFLQLFLTNVGASELTIWNASNPDAAGVNDVPGAKSSK